MRDLHIRIAALEEHIAELEKEAGVMDFAKNLLGKGSYDRDDVMSYALESLKKQYRMFDFGISGEAIHGHKDNLEVVLTFIQRQNSLDVSMITGTTSKRNVVSYSHPEKASFSREGLSKDIAKSIVQHFSHVFEDNKKTASTMDTFASDARQTIRSLMASKMDKLAIIEKQDIVPPEMAMKLMSVEAFESDLLDLMEREFVFVGRFGDVLWINNDDVAFEFACKKHGTNLSVDVKAFTLNHANPTKHDVLATHTFEVVNSKNAVDEIAPQIVKFMAHTLEQKNQHSNAKKLKLASVFYNETMRNLARYTANNPMAKKAFLKGASASMSQTQQPLRTRRDYGSY